MRMFTFTGSVNGNLLVPLKEALDSAFPEATIRREKDHNSGPLTQADSDRRYRQDQTGFSNIHIFYEFMNGY